LTGGTSHRREKGDKGQEKAKHVRGTRNFLDHKDSQRRETLHRKLFGRVEGQGREAAQQSPANRGELQQGGWGTAEWEGLAGVSDLDRKCPPQSFAGKGKILENRKTKTAGEEVISGI